MGRRVVVTGLGAVSALGANVDEFWRNLQDGVCGIQNQTVIGGEGLEITTPTARHQYFSPHFFGVI